MNLKLKTKKFKVHKIYVKNPYVIIILLLIITVSTSI